MRRERISRRTPGPRTVHGRFQDDRVLYYQSHDRRTLHHAPADRRLRPQAVGSEKGKRRGAALLLDDGDLLPVAGAGGRVRESVRDGPRAAPAAHDLFDRRLYAAARCRDRAAAGGVPAGAEKLEALDPGPPQPGRVPDGLLLPRRVFLRQRVCLHTRAAGLQRVRRRDAVHDPDPVRHLAAVLRPEEVGAVAADPLRGGLHRGLGDRRVQRRLPPERSHHDQQRVLLHLPALARQPARPADRAGESLLLLRRHEEPAEGHHRRRLAGYERPEATTPRATTRATGR